MNFGGNDDQLGIREFKDPQSDEDSGSLYETSLSGNEPIGTSDQEESSENRSLRENIPKFRNSSLQAPRSSSIEGDPIPGDTDNGTEVTEDQLRTDALAWASKFQAPDEDQIITPPRGRFYGRRPSKKRKASNSNSNALKRPKGFYSNEYRELLNNEIQDATAKIELANMPRLKESQIGSSVWSADEKNILFSLFRTGKDNVRAIAAQIGSKSELQVQEYIQVLNNATTGRLLNRDTESINYTDYPAAFEISQECCAVLEEAADWIATSQERHEELIERARWGQFWLLNARTSKLLSDQENDDDGRDTTQKIVPAAGLLNLKNWLHLAEDIFMNPSGTRKEDNWIIIAEPGETPGIRATAFQDFHSLAVSITKRLVSTVIFCASSKMRALDSKKNKHAHVSRDDVEAAVKILGLKADWNDYWVRCARRCNLEVYQASSRHGDDPGPMTYDEVEQQLSQELSEQSRFQHSRHYEKDDLTQITEKKAAGFDMGESCIADSDCESSTSQELRELGVLDLDDALSLNDSDSDFTDSRRQRTIQKAAQKRAKERAQDEYTEKFDAEASRMEEQRLWDMLKQTPPPRLKVEEVELPMLLKENQQTMSEDIESYDGP
ncbi:hypothetical protein B7463_g5713, partial [Scytalidium lignicola]